MGIGPSSTGIIFLSTGIEVFAQGIIVSSMVIEF
jgi:hypothetical protein